MIKPLSLSLSLSFFPKGKEENGIEECYTEDLKTVSVKIILTFNQSKKNAFPYFLASFSCLDIGSHEPQAGLDLAMKLRMT